MADETSAVYDDLGEQAVWRRLYPQVHELPAAYCALRTADLPAAEWPKVRVLHDPHLLHTFHRDGWVAAGMAARLAAIEALTGIVTDRERDSLHQEPFPLLPSTSSAEQASRLPRYACTRRAKGSKTTLMGHATSCIH